MKIPPLLRVLCYIPGFAFGGVESRIMEIHKNIDRNKIQLDILCLTDVRDNELLKELKKNGGKVYTLPSFRNNPVKYLRLLDEFFREHQYSVVHCYSVVTGYFFLKIAKKYGVQHRILHAVTSSFQGESFLYLRYLLKYIAVREANIYLAVSFLAAKWLLKGHPSNEVMVINNAVEMEKFVFNASKREKLRRDFDLENSFIIGHVGRYTYAKNHQFLLKVFADILNKNSDAKLLLVGCDLNDIKKEAADLNILDKIVAVGYQRDVSRFYLMMDVLVFPSIFEGLPGTLVEAQKSGLKCFVSDTITNEVRLTAGISFLSLQLHPKIWASKVIEEGSLYSREENQLMGDHNSFSIKHIVHEYEKLYLKCIQ